MDREERTRQFAIDMEVFGDYVIEWGGEHFDYDKTASALDKLGYRKIVWHKVEDGDLPKCCQNIWFIDGRTNLGFSGYYNDVEKIFISDFDNGFCIKKDEVIAWTDLPTYEEAYYEG